MIRVQAEHTYLDRSTTFRDRPTTGYYTSRAVVQGYTNRGQILGAAVGPGGSSHWLAADLVTGGWSTGLFAGRIRWDNDALYTTPVLTPATNKWCSHDVAPFTGVRGFARGGWGQTEGELTPETGSTSLSAISRCAVPTTIRRRSRTCGIPRSL